MEEEAPVQQLTKLKEQQQILPTGVVLQVVKLQTRFNQGKKFCVEYITTLSLLREEARGIDAAAVIIAKNCFNSNLLVFLSQKYQRAPRLLGILKILSQTNP